MITKVEVQGYRLLNEFEADLAPLTVVIGANATGKSTLQDLLRFVSQAAERPLKAVVKERGGFTSLLSAGARTRMERVGWQITVASPPHRSGWPAASTEPVEGLVYEAALSGFRGLAISGVEYEVLRSAGSGQAAPVIFLEHREGMAKVYDGVAGELVDFGINEPRAQDGPSLVLTQVRNLFRYRAVSAFRSYLASWAFYPGFRIDPDSQIRSLPGDVEPVTVLDPDGANLTTVLHEILTRHEYRGAAGDLRDWLRSAYPELEEITAEATAGARGKVTLCWHERGVARALNASELSDGVLRFLCLAVVLSNPAPSPLVVVDEPEVGLHPGLLPIVADMIKAAAEQTQVLVTTHSPDLLDFFDLDDVGVMVREDNSVRWHRPSSRRTLKMLLESVEGETLGDLHRSGELEAGA